VRLISLKIKWFSISVVGLLLIAMATAWGRYPHQEMLSKRFYLISEQRKGVNELSEMFARNGAEQQSNFHDDLTKWRDGHRSLRAVVVSGSDEVPEELMASYDQSFLALDAYFSDQNAQQAVQEYISAYEAAGDRLALLTSEALNGQLSAYRNEMLALLGGVLVLIMAFLRIFAQKPNAADEEETLDAVPHANFAPSAHLLARATVTDFNDYLVLSDREEQAFYLDAVRQLVILASEEHKVPAPFLLMGLLSDVRAFIALRHPKVDVEIEAIDLKSTEVHGDAELIGRTCTLLTDRILALTGAKGVRFVLNKVDASPSALHVRFDWHLRDVNVSKSALSALLDQKGKGLAVVETIVQMHQGRFWLDAGASSTVLKANFIFSNYAERSERIGLDQLQGKRVFCADTDAARLRDRVKALSEYGLLVTPFNSLTAFNDNPNLFSKFDFGVLTLPEEEAELYSFLAAVHSRQANVRLPLIALHPADRQPKEEKMWSATLPDLCTAVELADALVYVLREDKPKDGGKAALTNAQNVVSVRLNMN
jgi:hypothetical protein